MGKPTGFIEYERKHVKYRPVNERLKDYKDVMEYLSNDEIRTQAARCMDCGIPFCHSIGCPLGNLIPEWNDLVYRGKWDEAVKRLQATNPFPEITGRICPALCEPACTLSINSAPVTIKQIELAVMEYGFENGLIKPQEHFKQISKKIAIIGSGPAGLACAWFLRGKGYDVTVYEKSDKEGGVLRYGIPEFKLEKWVLDRRIRLMEESGIKFVIGQETEADFLKKSFDAIVLSPGSGEPRDIAVSGRELEGIYFAMDYLSQLQVNYEANYIYAKNKNVLVLGGGDTGSDCVGVANRQGASRVHLFEIMPKPVEWKEAYNPQWPYWPDILRTSSSHEEGADRRWDVLIRKFTGKDKKVKEAHFVNVEWKRNGLNSKPEFKEVPGSGFSIEIDIVILALGFTGVRKNRLFSDLKIEFDGKGNIRVDDNNRTSVENIFAAGDGVKGPSLVVHAIESAKDTAESVHKYLTGGDSV